MKNKLLTLFIFGMFLFSLSSITALESWGTAKQNTNFTITQICNDANYITLSTIQYPDKSVQILNANMTFVGGGSYQYNFSNTTQLGKYDVCGISDGCENTFCGYFEITPSGRESPSQGEGMVYLGSLGVILFMAVLFYVLSRSFNGGFKFGLIALSFVISIIGVLYSSISFIELSPGFARISASYQIFIYVILSVMVIIFIFLMISLILQALHSFRTKRGFNPMEFPG